VVVKNILLVNFEVENPIKQLSAHSEDVTQSCGENKEKQEKSLFPAKRTLFSS